MTLYDKDGNKVVFDCGYCREEDGLITQFDNQSDYNNHVFNHGQEIGVTILAEQILDKANGVDYLDGDAE